jgi:stage III sporulation protein AB
MLKLSGAALVMLACIGYGSGLLRQMRRHRDILNSFLTLTELLAGEIRYERIPIQDVLNRISDRVDPEIAVVLQQIAGELQQGIYASLEEVWNRNFQRARKSLLLTEEELAQVQAIGGNLGFLDHHAQLQHLAGCRERLLGSLANIQQELDEKTRIYRSLSLAAGVFVILILA